MATMYLSKENVTCPKKKQITVAIIYLTVLKQYINSLENSMKQDKPLVNSVDPDQLASEEASWSGPTLFSMQHVSS